VTVDCVPLRFAGSSLEVLLVRRGLDPFAGAWALPGGFLEIDEDLEDGARRELGEETGLAPAVVEQLGAVGTPDRDPRGRTVTVVFAAFVSPESSTPRPGSDAREVGWFPLDRLPDLAFDHREILARTRERLAEWMLGRPSVLRLLPDPFDREHLAALAGAGPGSTVDPDRLVADLRARRWIEDARSASGEGGSGRLRVRVATPAPRSQPGPPGSTNPGEARS
jgi:8-oxo-dGTP diphosphatase